MRHSAWLPLLPLTRFIIELLPPPLPHSTGRFASTFHIIGITVDVSGSVCIAASLHSLPVLFSSISSSGPPGPPLAPPATRFPPAGHRPFQHYYAITLPRLPAPRGYVSLLYTTAIAYCIATQDLQFPGSLNQLIHSSPYYGHGADRQSGRHAIILQAIIVMLRRSPGHYIIAAERSALFHHSDLFSSLFNLLHSTQHRLHSLARAGHPPHRIRARRINTGTGLGSAIAATSSPHRA